MMNNENILITGLPGAGKSIFANYLKSKFPTADLIEFDSFGNTFDFVKAIHASRAQHIIAVIQSENFISKLIPLSFFTRHYVCTRPGTTFFQVSDGLITQEFSFNSMFKYFDHRLDDIFASFKDSKKL